MDLVDLVLNLAGLLLWWSWRAQGVEKHRRPKALSLLSTLQGSPEKEESRWVYVFFLLLLLLLRSLGYWHLGSSMDWNPALSLGAIVIRFRSDFPDRMLLFSLVSFARVLGIFYLWLIALNLLNRGRNSSDPYQAWVRLHLGRLDRWPAPLLFLTPGLVVFLLWMLLCPWFASLGMVPTPDSLSLLARRAGLIALGAYLPVQYGLMGLIGFYILNSYVYLGHPAFWSYISQSARSLVRLLDWLPLRFGRLDLRPFLALALLWTGFHFFALALHYAYSQLPL